MSNIVEMLAQESRFSTLVSAIQAANLVETLNGPGPFTLFAPTDDAFAGLPEGTIASMLADVPHLTKLLTYHVVTEKVTAADLSSRTMLPTVEGDPIKIQKIDNRTFINDAMLTQIDLQADNGIIHVIDQVLLPPTPTSKA
jgi:uncharacterized surface protein with fasciclin (FAS1) repeats